MVFARRIYQAIPPLLLLLHLAAGFIYGVYIAFFTDTLGGDTLEHIHSSWLVYAGFVPYKDFFQHHNPLLWYVFAPLVGLHASGTDDNLITSLVTFAAIVASFLNFWYLYKIASRFLTDKFGGLIAASIALTPYVLLSIINFRPDNFMLAAFFAGLYYYFCYLSQKRLPDLIFSFLLFWCSFMFLQKIIFTLLLMGLVTFYLLWQKEIRLKDFLWSILLPIVLSLGFAAFLWQHNILALWYHSNFTFNLYIPELFDERRIGQFWPELKLLLAASGVGVLYCIKRSNIYFKILVLIFVAEFLQRLFYFSAFAYYYCLLIYTASLLAAVFLEEKLFKRYYTLSFVLAVPLCVLMYKPAIYNGNIGGPKSRFYEPLNKAVVRVSTPCDYILNGDGTIYNLYNRDPHYYWNLLGQTDVIGAKVGIAPLMDINRIIETYKPKIISVKPYKDKYYAERGQEVIVHLPDMEMINKYYRPFNNSPELYILKPEYSHLKCDYDYKNRYYRAYD